MAGLALGETIRRSVLTTEPALARLYDERGDLYASLDPGYRLPAVDGRRIEVREGLRISLMALEELVATCSAAGARVVVLLIPTKVSVLAGLVEAAPETALRNDVARLVSEEAERRTTLIDWLEQHEVTTIDVLPRLRDLATHRLYPSGRDGHPNAAGYREIATVVDRVLYPPGSQPDGSSAPPAD